MSGPQNKQQQKNVMYIIYFLLSLGFIYCWFVRLASSAALVKVNAIKSNTIQISTTATTTSTSGTLLCGQDQLSQREVHESNWKQMSAYDRNFWVRFGYDQFVICTFHWLAVWALWYHCLELAVKSIIFTKTEIT